MQIFLAALFGGFLQVAGSLVGRVLLSLGIGYVTFTGVDLALTAVRDMAFAQLDASSSAMPVVRQFLGVFQVGTCFNIIFSAYSARLVLNGLTGGSIKRMVTK